MAIHSLKFKYHNMLEQCTAKNTINILVQILRFHLRPSASWMWKVPAYTKDNSQIMLNHSLQILPAVLTSLWHQHGYLQLDKQVEEGGWHRHKGELLLFLVLGVLDVHFRHLATSFILVIFTHLPNQTDQPSMNDWPFICCISYLTLGGHRTLNYAALDEGGRLSVGRILQSLLNCWRLWESWKGRQCHVQG